MKHFGKYMSLKNQLLLDLEKSKNFELKDLPKIFKKYAIFLKKTYDLLKINYEFIEPPWISGFIDKVGVISDQCDEINKTHYDKKLIDIVLELQDEFYIHYSPEEVREEIIKRVGVLVKEAIDLSKLEYTISDTNHFESIKTSLNSAAINIFFEKVSMIPIVKQQYGEIIHQSAYEVLKHISNHFDHGGQKDVGKYVLSIFTHARTSLKTHKRVNSIIDFLETACAHAESDFLNVDYYKNETEFFINIRQKILRQEHIATEIKYLVRKGWEAERIIDFKHYDSDFWNNTLLKSVIHYDSHALKRVEIEVSDLYSNFIDDVNHWLIQLDEKFKDLKEYIKNPGKFHNLFENREKKIREMEDKVDILLNIRLRVINKQQIKGGKSIFSASKELSKGAALIEEYNSLAKKGIYQHASIKELNFVLDSAYNEFKHIIIKQLKELQKINKQLLHLKLKIIDSNNKKRVLIRALKKKREFPYLLTIVSCIAFSLSLSFVGMYKFKVLLLMGISFIGVCIGIYKNFKIISEINKIKNKKFM